MRRLPETASRLAQKIASVDGRGDVAMGWCDLYVRFSGHSEAEDKLRDLALRAAFQRADAWLLREITSSSADLFVMCSTLDKHAVAVPDEAPEETGTAGVSRNNN